MKIFLQLFLLFFPWRFRVFFLRKLYGFEISHTAKICFSVIDTKNLRMSSSSSIGHLNYVRSCRLIQLGSNSSIGNLNWISGEAAYLPERPGDKVANGTLLLADHAAITGRHYIDCSGGISVGAFSILAGVRSSVLTHEIDLYRSIQMTKSVWIDDYCFIGTGCTLTSGCTIPRNCVLAAGSVNGNELNEPKSLYGGVPARKIKDLDDDTKFFTRQAGFVD